MGIKRVIAYLVIIGIVIAAYQWFSGLPVTRVAFVESTLDRGAPSLFSIVISKIFDNRRELVGNDPYKVYVFVGDKDGVSSVSLTHNGEPIPFEIADGEDNGELEFDGDTETGLHTYVVQATDSKGNKSRGALIINVRVVPVMPVGGIM